MWGQYQRLQFTFAIIVVLFIL
ncbi:sporulation protein YjcZ [Lysinibacillus pakistanensis]|uniref:Sporulation protein YjcZ n=1 Tax=Lysinibacillus pakistanensis TaxID=759811 RepID=A0ABX6DGE8_9BACI|nr:sporulation protein YjcZ [Lysinibacillus pakistanensis]